MERLIHYLNYGTRVTFHDPVILFREQEWATRARDFAQLEWLVRERGESLSFFSMSFYLFINFYFISLSHFSFCARFDPKGRR